MIHVFKESENCWAVWTDCSDREEKTGRCIGVANTKLDALIAAKRELEADLQQLNEVRL
jgi:hypothetical protein